MGNSDSAFAGKAFSAVRSGNEKKIKQLLGRKKYKNINVQDGEGATLLSAAAQNSNIGISGLLISAGSNVNLPDSKGLTPLHKAVIYNYDEKLALLLIGNEIE